MFFSAHIALICTFFEPAIEKLYDIRESFCGQTIILAPKKYYSLMFNSFYTKLKKDRRIRYMVAGAINTAIGYVSPIFLYSFLCELLPAAAISALASCICISVTFVMYKLFCFQNKRELGKRIHPLLYRI